MNATGAGLLAGPRIEQGSLTTALAGTTSIGAAEIQSRLARAHATGGRPCPGLGTAALEAARDLSRIPPSPLEARWTRFAGGSLDAAAMARVLQTAAQSLILNRTLNPEP